MDAVQESSGGTNLDLPSRISARGVISGVLVGLACEAMLMVLGTAIGLTALRPRFGVARDVGLAFSAWLLLATIVSAFFGAMVAAGAARSIRRRDGVLHGVVTWAGVTLIGVSPLGGMIVRPDESVGSAAIGTWGMFAAMLLPLLAAIGGGALAAGRERRNAGLAGDPRRRLRRRPIVRTPPRSSEVSDGTLPAT
jgi:hypothetical protein